MRAFLYHTIMCIWAKNHYEVKNSFKSQKYQACLTKHVDNMRPFLCIMHKICLQCAVREGVKNVQNCMTSFMNDPFAVCFVHSPTCSCSPWKMGNFNLHCRWAEVLNWRCHWQIHHSINKVFNIFGMAAVPLLWYFGYSGQFT